MGIRHVVGPIAVGLLTWGLVAVIPARGRAQEATVLPESKGPITLVGCFLRQEVRGHDKYVLARPTIGPATSVTEARCTSTEGEQVVRLERARKVGLDESALGRWIEVSGKLERIEDGGAREPRELEVKSVRIVPVVVPHAAETPVPEFPPPPSVIRPAPPQPQAFTPPQEAPTGTTGVKERRRLPHTASPLPLTGLIGLLALAGGLILLVDDRQRILGRG
jgi:hypothetical protein